MKFLVEHKYQRIILDVPYNQLDNFYIEGLNIVRDVVAEKKYYNDNMTIRFPNYERIDESNIKLIKKLINVFKKIRVPFYFNTPIDSWDVLQGHIALGVSDVLIVNELGFALDKVRAIVGKDVKIRCYPNVAQSRWDDTPGIKCFWIRPEDMMMYDPYIDVLEFFQTPGNTAISDINVLYNIYFLRGKWAGDLNELILYYEGSLDSNYVVPQFPLRRAICGKKCYMGGNCRICDEVEKLSLTLSDKRLTPFQEKDSDYPTWGFDE